MTEFPNPKPARGRPLSGRWNELTDGSIWAAVRGTDFHGCAESFRGGLYHIAKRRGKRVKTEIVSATEVRFQFREV